MPGAIDYPHPPVPATPGRTTPVTALCGEQHLDDPAADARFEALLTIPALRTFLAPGWPPTA